MRRIKTFMDLLLYKDWDGEHIRREYSPIYGKIIYPVAFNPLDSSQRKSYYKFGKNNRYEMIR